MAYYSRHTGEEVDSLLDKVKEGDVVEVDTSLSSTSKNPVQNKVVTSALSNKQDKLISGTNIKTINSIPILGEGNIIISGGGTEGGVSYEEVEQMLAGKQNVIDDLDSIREGASKGATALQEEDLSSVAISGDYNDLTNKPTIPSAITEETVSGWGFTKNEGTYIKPDGGIPSSDLSNDVQSSLNKADTALQSYTEQYKGTVTGVKMNGEVKGTSGEVDLGTVITEHQDISGKQDVLVSGENIKTINGVSILGEGDITIEGGGESYDDTELRNLISEKQDALVSGQNIKTINGSSLLGAGNIVIASEGGVSYDDTELRNLISNKVDKVEGKALSTNDFTDADKTKLDSLENYDDTNVVSLIRDKQDKLVSGTNIKTINGTSILGEGNIDIEAGVYDDTELRNMIAEKQDTIEDLSTIRENASKGATALQSVPSEYINETELQQQLSTKADINGDYPDMSVGLAEDLGGRPFTNDAEFSFRATADKDNSIKDGLASIKTLKGNSVVWNQKFEQGAIRSDAGAQQYYDEATGEMVIDGTITTGTQYSGSMAYGGKYADLVVGHKYLTIIRKISGTYSGTTSYIYLEGSGHLKLYTGDTERIGFWEAKSNSIPYSIITFQVGDTFNNLRYIIRNHDLTQMFGEGNEPTTIEEFYSRCPIGVDMNAYNEGEVIHMTAEGIKSVGDNAWDEEWEEGIVDDGNNYFMQGYIRSKNYIKVIGGAEYFYTNARGNDQDYIKLNYFNEDKKYLGKFNVVPDRKFTIPNNAHYIRFYANATYGATYTNDIMITLVHSGWKQDTDAGYQPYWEDNLMFDQRIKDEFPDGMKKWDKVYNKDGKGYIVKGTGVADMGELDWVYTSGNISKFSTLMKSDAEVYEDSVISNMISPIYITHPNNFSAPVDKVIYRAGSYIGVYDSSYTDAASFKAAMAGVPLYYELAEPTIIEYDEPFNLDYKVADFGTEQAIGSTPSAPISAEIEYDFGANDTIRTNKLAINELREKIKEVTIEDIDTIREGAAKGMTAIQEHQDISHLATKEELNAISSSGMNYVELNEPTVPLAAVNTCYYMMPLNIESTFTVSAFETPTTPVAHYKFMFWGPNSLTLPSVYWLNAEIPEMDASCLYELDIVATEVLAEGNYVYKAVLAKFNTVS